MSVDTVAGWKRKFSESVTKSAFKLGPGIRRPFKDFLGTSFAEQSKTIRCSSFGIHTRYGTVVRHEVRIVSLAPVSLPLEERYHVSPTIVLQTPDSRCGVLEGRDFGPACPLGKGYRTKRHISHLNKILWYSKGSFAFYAQKPHELF